MADLHGPDLGEVQGGIFRMLSRRFLVAVAALSLVVLAGIPAFAQFPAQGDDTTTSLGSFQVNIAAQFQPLFAGCPAYNATTNMLQSPTLFDPATDIGRSSAITAGSAAETNGVPVGGANDTVSEASSSRRLAFLVLA
jgi:hypothetical protein